MRYVFALSLVTLATGFVVAQEKKPDPNEPIKVVTLDRKDPVTYEKDVEPILLNKCAVCHSGNVKEAKFDVSSYEEMMKGGKRGKPIEPGKSAESRLYHLSGKTMKPYMPPRSEEPLTPQELAIIKLWIDQGAKAPTGARPKPIVTVNVPHATVQPVRGVVVSPDKTTVIASRGNQIHVYDAKEGKYLKSLVDDKLVGPDKKPIKGAHVSLVESLAFSPDGKLLVSGSFQELIIWDMATGTVKQKITGFAERVVALAFSKDGKLLATGGGAPTEDGELRIYDVDTAKMLIEIKNSHSDTVFGVAFSPDGKMLASCGVDKYVKVFEVPSGKFIKSFEGHTQHVLGVGWKNDGKQLVSGGADNALKFWDFEKGEQIKTTANAHGKQVTALVVASGANQFLTTSGDKQVKVWSLDNGNATRTLTGFPDYVYAVGASTDGTVVAAGGEDGVVRLFVGGGNTAAKTLVPPDAAKEEVKEKK